MRTINTTTNLIGFILFAFLAGAILSALTGCTEPPPPPPVMLPEPAPFAPAVLTAIADAHGPSTCAVPLLQTLSAPQFLEITAQCGAGHCSGCGSACSGAELVDGVIVTVETAWDGDAIRLALETLHACEGTTFDVEAWRDILDALGLR